MITLITGSPGAGKTLYCVSEILGREYRERVCYVSGIPDLRLGSVPAGDPLDWPTWAPDGCVVVVDEAQRSFRPRPSGSRVPDAVAALETHRHRGLDFVLLTQRPQLLDVNIRGLVGRHIHVRRLFGMQQALIYEWDSCSESLKFSQATKKGWVYPRSSFSLYKSAELHTKRKHAVPFALFVVLFSFFAVPALGYFAYTRISGHLSSAVSDPVRSVSSAPAPAPGASATGPAPGLGLVSDALFSDSSWRPRRSEYPESAPLYDGLRKVQSLPHLAGCMRMGERCSCYTETGTVVDLEPLACDRRVVDVPLFNPFRASGEAARPTDARSDGSPGSPAAPAAPAAPVRVQSVPM